MIRAGFLLLSVILIGHTLLQGGRFYVVREMEDTYGRVAIDEQGRVRHWDGHFSHYYWFLSADEVAGADAWIEGDEWLREARIPVATRAARSNMGGRWLGSEADRPVASGHAAVGLGVGVERSTWLTVRPDGAAWIQWMETGPGGAAEYGDQLPVEAPVKYPPIAHGKTIDGAFFGFVNEEFWIVDRDGRLLQRQPVGIEPPASLEFLTCTFGDDGAALLKCVEGPVRPDRMAVRMVLFRRDAEPVSRLAVIEPVTEEQRLNASLFGVLGALRPLPLIVASMAWDAPATRAEMLEHWWLEPFFAQGANAGWLGVAALLTLVCAFIAFRWTRLRVDAIGARIFWVVAVAAFGPMGLLWMRLAIPWYAVENGRAVNLGEWPAPEPTGTEVFA